MKTIIHYKDIVMSDRDRAFFSENSELLTILRHCDRLAGCQGNEQDVSLAMGEIRTICRHALSKVEGNA